MRLGAYGKMFFFIISRNSNLLRATYAILLDFKHFSHRIEPEIQFSYMGMLVEFDILLRRKKMVIMVFLVVRHLCST